VAASSGHSAQFLAIATIAKAGDNIIATSFLYGGTSNQFRNFFPQLGITVKIVTGDDPNEFAKLIDENTKALYIESIGNPRANVPDFKAFANLAHENDIPLIVRFLIPRGAEFEAY
jgi:O-acetylhomoserine/O-acetylserine sulfhydrylase-like pyridoxal-dependent enzyme